MQSFPHHYHATSTAGSTPYVQVHSSGLESIDTAPPAEFGGPGDKWSPETLLVASVANCYILTFQAIARASKLDWQTLECSVEGILDRVDNVTRFTHINISAKLLAGPETDENKARHILEKSEAVCLITNSLTAEKRLHIELVKSD